MRGEFIGVAQLPRVSLDYHSAVVIHTQRIAWSGV